MSVQPTPPVAVVIFGATGALTAHKLMPALFSLFNDGYLPDQVAVVGIGRRPKDDAGFRAEVEKLAVAGCRNRQAGPGGWARFAERVVYHQQDFNRADTYAGLRERLDRLDRERGLAGNRLYYLAVDPEFFGPIVGHLREAGLIAEQADGPWTRVVIEKPFGFDLASARELDRGLHRSLREEQIYRIDHYLGKDTVQNLLSFRFGNAVFEPLFNRRYVNHVQLTVAESGGMDGRRGAYYDHSGAIRDVLQNHLLQLLALVAMEPPARLTAKELRDEKVKVLRSLVPLRGPEVARWVVRGQYGPGTADGKPAPGYRQEEAVAADSATDTFVAVRAQIDNWRWADVPFLLRTGKRLAKRVTEVAVHFRAPPTRLFTHLEGDGAARGLGLARANVLVFRIQPQEGISLQFAAKRPGMELELEPVRMDFRYDQAFDGCLPEAYERLLLDALRGDASLFMRSDEVEAAWEFVTPILEAWRDQPKPAFPNYAAGSWGPAEADKLTDGCCQAWRQP